MSLSYVTGLGRHLDPRLASNRIAIAGAAAVGVAHGLLELVSGDGLVIVGSAVAGVLAFLAWAVAREIDPDDTATATLAMVLAAPFAILGTGSALVVATVLIGIRMIAGTTGVALMASDVAVVVIAAVVAALVPGGWVTVPVVALGAWLASAQQRATVTLVALAAGATAAVLGDGLNWEGEPRFGVVAIIVTGIAHAIGSRGPVHSSVDAGDRLMDSRRISLAGRVAGATGVAATFAVAGVSGVVVLAPVVAAAIRSVSASTREPQSVKV